MNKLAFIFILCLLVAGCAKKQEDTPAPKEEPKQYLYDAYGNKYEILGHSEGWSNAQTVIHYMSLKYVPVFRNESGTNFYTCTEGSIVVYNVPMTKITNPEDYKRLFESKTLPPIPPLEKKEQ